MRIPPPLDEPRRPGIRFRVLGEFHEGAGEGLVKVRELEAEDVGLVLDVAGEAGRYGRQEERNRGAEGQQPWEGGGVAALLAHGPAAPPPRQAALVQLLADREDE